MMEERGRWASSVRNACDRIGINIWDEGKKKAKESR